MQRSDIRQLLTALLLGFTLTVPSLSLAEHLHDSVKEELSCETCSLQSQAIMVDTICTEVSPAPRTRPTKERTRIPFETFRLNERNRGPPLH